MKSFSLLPDPLAIPARYADDYSPAERLHLCQAFEAKTLKYRRNIRTMLYMVIAFLSSVALIPLIGTDATLGFDLICFLVCAGAVATVPALVCPGCDFSLETAGRYCPECGGTPLRPSNRFFKPLECTVCGKKLSFGRSQRYKIRACTHCGLKLGGNGI